MPVLSAKQWSVLEPLIEAVRPQTGRELTDLRRTLEAIIWRLHNGAKWRAIPAELGPWWMAAQTFLRWSKLGVWERFFEAAKAAGRRGATNARSSGFPACHPGLGRRRPRLLVSCGAHGRVGAGLQAGHPDPAQRGCGALPGLDLCEPGAGRADVEPAQGMACDRDPWSLPLGLTRGRRRPVRSCRPCISPPPSIGSNPNRP